MCGVLPVTAQEIPTLRGYRLGASFQEARANRLPCQQIETRLRCDRPDSVWLFFEHDTLTGIVVNFPFRPVTAQARWFAVSDSLIALHGEPDSVTVKSDILGAGAVMTILKAHWVHLTAAQPWGSTYTIIEGSIIGGKRANSFATFDISAC